MGFLLPTLTQDKLDNQRDVVRNERRENFEMRPYGLASRRSCRNLWNPEFPYHWKPIGSHEDLEAATLGDVKEFFERWYGPENAVLAIAGDIDAGRTRRARREKWFGGDPRQGAAGRTRRPRRRRSRPRSGSTMEDRVQLPRLYMAWQTPKVFARRGRRPRPRSAQVLSDGKSARLVKRLVMDERIAQSVSAGQMSAGARGHVPRGRDAEAGRPARAAREGDRRGDRAARRRAAERRGAAAREEQDRGRRDLRRSSRWAGSAAGPPRSPTTTCAPATRATSPQDLARYRARHARGRVGRGPPLPPQGRARRPHGHAGRGAPADRAARAPAAAGAPPIDPAAQEPLPPVALAPPAPRASRRAAAARRRAAAPRRARRRAAAARRPPGRTARRSPALGPAPELRAPGPAHFALANGLKVRLVEYRAAPDGRAEPGRRRGRRARPGEPARRSRASPPRCSPRARRPAAPPSISDEVGLPRRLARRRRRPGRGRRSPAPSLAKHLAEVPRRSSPTWR